MVYSQTTNISSPKFYLILKNFGQTGATVTSFKCDHDLASCSYSLENVPFNHISGTFVAPGQAFITNLNTEKLFSNPQQIHISIEYLADKKLFSDSFTINLDAYSDLLQTRLSLQDQELKTISYALQDISEKFL